MEDWCAEYGKPCLSSVAQTTAQWKTVYFELACGTSAALNLTELDLLLKAVLFVLATFSLRLVVLMLCYLMRERCKT